MARVAESTHDDDLVREDGVQGALPVHWRGRPRPLHGAQDSFLVALYVLAHLHQEREARHRDAADEDTEYVKGRVWRMLVVEALTHLVQGAAYALHRYALYGRRDTLLGPVRLNALVVVVVLHIVDVGGRRGRRYRQRGGRARLRIAPCVRR